MPLQSQPWDSQPLPAYQYFENIRNFLVAVEELKLPMFDASVFERVGTKCPFTASTISHIIPDVHELFYACLGKFG